MLELSHTAYRYLSGVIAFRLPVLSIEPNCRESNNGEC